MKAFAVLLALMLFSAIAQAQQSRADIEEFIRQSFLRAQDINVPRQNPNCGVHQLSDRPTHIVGVIPEKPVPVPQPRPNVQPSPTAGPVGTPVCPGYLNRDGSFGVKGKRIADQISKGIYAQTLLSDAAGKAYGMNIACPNWKNLSIERRKQFWAWTFAAISAQESSCTRNKHTYKPKFDIHSDAIGEFQLNYQHRYRHWRGKSWGGRNCAKASVTNDASNAACAVDIMMDQFRGVYNRRQPGLLGTSYWAELKTDRKPSRLRTSPILKNIKKFGPCGAR